MPETLALPVPARLVVGYLRESQEAVGSTLDEREGQRNDIIRLALADGIAPESIVWADDWGRSATGATRPAYERMVEAIRSGNVAVVYARAVDRLNRDGDESRWFVDFAHRSGVRVVTSREGDLRLQDRTRQHADTFIAAMESDRGMDRARRGRDLRVERMTAHRNACPFGLVGVRWAGDRIEACNDAHHWDGVPGYGLAGIDGEDLAAVIRAYAATGSYTGTAKALNDAGVLTRKQARAVAAGRTPTTIGWDSTSVGRIIGFAATSGLLVGHVAAVDIMRIDRTNRGTRQHETAYARGRAPLVRARRRARRDSIDYGLPYESLLSALTANMAPLLPSGRRTRRPRTIATHALSMLVRCPCGETLTATYRTERSGRQVGLFCRKGRTTVGHTRPYFVAQRLVLDWLRRAMVATTGSPVHIAGMRADVEARVATLTAERDALIATLATMTNRTVAESIEAEVRRIENDIAAVEREGSEATTTFVGGIDWDLPEHALNARLRTLIHTILLDASFRPTAVVWRDQPYRHDEDTGESVPDDRALPYESGWRLPFAS